MEQEHVDFSDSFRNPASLAASRTAADSEHIRIARADWSEWLHMPAKIWGGHGEGAIVKDNSA
jgi:hypothetical protein